MADPAGFLLWQLSTEARMAATDGRVALKSTYQQNRNGQIIWVHDPRQAHPDSTHRAIWNAWVRAVFAGKAEMKTAAAVGYISPEISDWLRAHGMSAPKGTTIIATRKAIQHAMDEGKAARGAGITEDEMISLPDHLAKPKAVLWDAEDPALVYVFDRAGKHRGKLIVRIDYREKGYGVVNSFKTAGVADVGNLLSHRYLPIIGNP